MSHRAFIYPKEIAPLCKELWRYYKKEPGARKSDVMLSFSRCHLCEEYVLNDESWPPINASKFDIDLATSAMHDLERYSCDEVHCDNCAKECIRDSIEDDHNFKLLNRDYEEAVYGNSLYRSHT